jgi:hypothetical protein
MLTFDEPPVQTEACNETETDYPCAMIITIDYQLQEIKFSSLTDAESLTIDGITYDSLTEHVVYLEHSDNSTEHVFCITFVVLVIIVNENMRKRSFQN